MNIQGLIERYEKFKASKKKMTSVDLVLKDLRTLDEPEPLPFKLKDVVRRIRGFDPTTQTRWLNDILKELGDDYGSMKYREGYEQGKFEGMVKREKVTIPKFVANWIEVCKEHLTTSLYTAMNPNFMKENNQSFDLILWIKKTSNQELFAQAWIFGYEVETEKRYRIKLKSNSEEIDYLVNTERNGLRFYSTIYTQRREHTRKELEDAGFGWVFDCTGIEIEEVTE